MGIVSSLGLKSSNHFALASVASLKDRKSTRLNSSHDQISYAVFCLKKKKKIIVVLYEINTTCKISSQDQRTYAVVGLEKDLRCVVKYGIQIVTSTVIESML